MNNAELLTAVGQFFCLGGSLQIQPKTNGRVEIWAKVTLKENPLIQMLGEGKLFEYRYIIDLKQPTGDRAAGNEMIIQTLRAIRDILDEMRKAGCI